MEELKKMSKQRLILIGAALLGAISAFLPWATASALGITQSTSGTSANDGIITLIAFIAAGVLAVLGNREEAVTENKFKYGIVAAGAAGAAIAIINLIDINNTPSIMGVGLSVGIGIYLTILAGAALIAVPFIKQINDLDKK